MSSLTKRFKQYNEKIKDREKKHFVRCLKNLSLLLNFTVLSKMKKKGKNGQKEVRKR